MGRTPVYDGPSVLPINSHFNVDEPFDHRLGFLFVWPWH